MSSIKEAATIHSVHPLIRERWSARSFKEESIPLESIFTILEAATWAASGNNEQPWQFLYTTREDVSFNTIWSCLMGGNQPWAKNAGAFIVVLANTNSAATGKPNSWAAHDAGMATAHILLQARALDIFCHPMAGYHKEMLKDKLQLADDVSPLCIIALGYLAEADILEEPFKTRELTPRTRKSLDEVARRI
jgi:nitroreductase